MARLGPVAVAAASSLGGALGINQPRVSKLLRGRLADFKVERLIQFCPSPEVRVFPH